MGAGEQAHAEHVHVFLYGGRDDLFGGPVQARIDDLHARVPQAARDDLGAAVVAVEADLGDHHANGTVRHEAGGRGGGR